MSGRVEMHRLLSVLMKLYMPNTPPKKKWLKCWLVCSQQNSYSISHLLGTAVTTLWLDSDSVVTIVNCRQLVEYTAAQVNLSRSTLWCSLWTIAKFKTCEMYMSETNLQKNICLRQFLLTYYASLTLCFSAFLFCISISVWKQALIKYPLPIGLCITYLVHFSAFLFCIHNNLSLEASFD